MLAYILITNDTNILTIRNLYVRQLNHVLKRSYLGGFYGGGTPVPIPNTAVKPTRADDSRKAKVGSRQDMVFFYNQNFFRLTLIRFRDSLIVTQLQSRPSSL
jgi:hypothetical protein